VLSPTMSSPCTESGEGGLAAFDVSNRGVESLDLGLPILLLPPEGGVVMGGAPRWFQEAHGDEGWVSPGGGGGYGCGNGPL